MSEMEVMLEDVCHRSLRRASFHRVTDQVEWRISFVKSQSEETNVGRSLRERRVRQKDLPDLSSTDVEEASNFHLFQIYFENLTER